MYLYSITFYVFSLVAVLSALMVISARNPVHSVLFLILSFVNASGLFVLLGAEFLAMILVIVYVGAVAVLFLFVVMMLDINFVKLREGFLQYLPFGALLGIVLIIELGILFLTRSFSENSLSKFVESPMINEIENTKLIGQVLYTDYFYLFQISGLILLVAMVGSITLTLRDRGQVKRQNISQQNYLNANESIEKKNIKLGEGIK
ncbi:MAG: NADH-quinone oxidoreductase subunit J [Alphaproteobacteria bacterium]|nr:NADH-quinone oxidoreductase subunit J [Alphaproteobacteria bacterium]